MQKILLAAVIGLLVFQSPLESVFSEFSYIDELVALMGAVLGIYDILILRKGRPSREQLLVGIPLLLFVLIGLTGNVLYRYQPWKSVIIDLYTNLKFFFAIGTGYYLFRNLEWQEKKEAVCRGAKSFALFLFVCFLADRFFHIWPSVERYGIASAQLFYFHPTYLAGATALLVTALTVFYDKRNLPFIAMALVIMGFTLRAKSLASAAAYVAMYVFFLIWKKELRLWHVVCAGAGCILIAWDKIRFYFIDLAGRSARSLLTSTSIQIMKDYFPIGTGFGTYGSAEAEKCYSPVYVKYGLNNDINLRNIHDIDNIPNIIQNQIARDPAWERWYQEKPEVVVQHVMQEAVFLCDTFWPIIFGQTGFLGTITYIGALLVVWIRCMKVKQYDIYAFVGALFAMVYLLISSMAEPAYHNSISIGLALLIGIVFKELRDGQRA